MLLIELVLAHLNHLLAHRGLTWWPWKITQQHQIWMRVVAGPRCLEYVLTTECWIGVGFWVDPCILRLDGEQGACENE